MPIVGKFAELRRIARVRGKKKRAVSLTPVIGKRTVHGIARLFNMLGEGKEAIVFGATLELREKKGVKKIWLVAKRYKENVPNKAARDAWILASLKKAGCDTVKIARVDESNNTLWLNDVTEHGRFKTDSIFETWTGVDKGISARPVLTTLARNVSNPEKVFETIEKNLEIAEKAGFALPPDVWRIIVDEKGEGKVLITDAGQILSRENPEKFNEARPKYPEKFIGETHPNPFEAALDFYKNSTLEALGYWRWQKQHSMQ